MVTERHVIGSEGITVSKLIWRRYSRQMPGLVEQTLALNPHLATLPPELPVGTVIDIPIVDKTAQKAVKVVRLWD